MTQHLQDLVKSLQVQATQVYVSARGSTIEHNLLCEKIEKVPLHCGYLEIAGCGGQVVQDDDMNVIEGAYSLQTDGLQCHWMMENQYEM